MSNVVTDPLIIPLGIAALPPTFAASFLFWQVLIYILIKNIFFFILYILVIKIAFYILNCMI